MKQILEKGDKVKLRNRLIPKDSVCIITDSLTTREGKELYMVSVNDSTGVLFVQEDQLEYIPEDVSESTSLHVSYNLLDNERDRLTALLNSEDFKSSVSVTYYESVVKHLKAVMELHTAVGARLALLAKEYGKAYIRPGHIKEGYIKEKK